MMTALSGPKLNPLTSVPSPAWPGPVTLTPLSHSLEPATWAFCGPACTPAPAPSFDAPALGLLWWAQHHLVT